MAESDRQIFPGRKRWELDREGWETLLTALAPEDALRSAQLAMMNDPRWSQPYYWAAFTMQGAQ